MHLFSTLSFQIRAEYEARLAKGFEKAVVEGRMLATPPGASGASGQASPSLSTPTSSPREGGYARVQQALLETRLKVCIVSFFARIARGVLLLLVLVRFVFHISDCAR